MFSSNLGTFSAIISLNSFSLLSPSSLLWGSHYACVGMFNGVSHFSKALFIFLHSFLSVFIRLHNLHQSFQKFANSFWVEVGRVGEWARAQMLQTLALLRFSRFSWINISLFAICPYGHFSEILNGCFFQIDFTNYGCFSGERGHRVPLTTIPEAISEYIINVYNV